MNIIQMIGFIESETINKRALQKLAIDSKGKMVTKDGIDVGKIIDTEIIGTILYFTVEIDDSIIMGEQVKYSVGFTMGENNG